MVRTLLYIVGGVLLGLVIHLVVILILPRISENSVYTRIAAMDALNALDSAGARIGPDPATAKF